MELKIINITDEPLLSRKLVKASIEFEKSTPSYAEVTSSLSSNLKTDEKLVAIRHIYNSFGAKKAEVTAYVYADEIKKQLIEPKPKEKKEKNQKRLRSKNGSERRKIRKEKIKGKMEPLSGIRQ